MTDTKQDICKADTIGVIGMNDLISRQAAIDEVLNLNVENRVSWRDAVIDTIDVLPSAQPDCAECPEYDHEAHSCQTYCDVIRRTVEEAKQKRTGRWINNHCSECGAVCRDIRDKWCYGCGARMEEPEDIPMEYFESWGR